MVLKNKSWKCEGRQHTKRLCKSLLKPSSYWVALFSCISWSILRLQEKHQMEKMSICSSLNAQSLTVYNEVSSNVVTARSITAKQGTRAHRNFLVLLPILRKVLMPAPTGWQAEGHVGIRNRALHICPYLAHACMLWNPPYHRYMLCILLLPHGPGYR